MIHQNEPQSMDFTDNSSNAFFRRPLEPSASIFFLLCVSEVIECHRSVTFITTGREFSVLRYSHPMRNLVLSLFSFFFRRRLNLLLPFFFLLCISEVTKCHRSVTLITTGREFSVLRYSHPMRILIFSLFSFKFCLLFVGNQVRRWYDDRSLSGTSPRRSWTERPYRPKQSRTYDRS